jgi:hypothetical protein
MEALSSDRTIERYEHFYAPARLVRYLSFWVSQVVPTCDNRCETSRQDARMRLEVVETLRASHFAAANHILFHLTKNIIGLN